VGVIRALSASPWIACNWAVGSFMLVSVGSWNICKYQLKEERRKVERIMEVLPKRTLKKKEDGPVDPAAATNMTTAQGSK